MYNVMAGGGLFLALANLPTGSGGSSVDFEMNSEYRHDGYASKN
jgi:hypothetical protein